jgi:hypothetical protein
MRRVKSRDQDGRVIYVAKDDAEIAAYSATLNLTDDEAETLLTATGRFDSPDERHGAYGDELQLHLADDDLEIVFMLSVSRPV